MFNVHFDGPSVPAELEIPFELGGSAVRGCELSPEPAAVSTKPAVVYIVGSRSRTHELFVKLKPGEMDFAVRIEPVPDTRCRRRTRTVQISTDGGAGVVRRERVHRRRRRSSMARPGYRWWRRITAPVKRVIPACFTVRREGSLDVPLDVKILMTGPAENGRDYEFHPVGDSLQRQSGGGGRCQLAPYPDDVRELAEAAEMVIQPERQLYSSTRRRRRPPF